MNLKYAACVEFLGPRSSTCQRLPKTRNPGVDINAQTNEGHTALEMALTQRHFSGTWMVGSDSIITSLLEHGGSGEWWTVFEEARKGWDTRLVHLALESRHGMDQILVGVLVGKGRLNARLLFSEADTAKEAHSRKRLLQKQHDGRRQAHMRRKSAERLKALDANEVHRPCGSKSRSSWKWTEFDFVL